MANWFNNTLTVFGPRHAVEAFMERARLGDSPLNAKSLVPEPRNAEESWRYDNWGCWIASAEKVVVKPYNPNILATYDIDSANGWPSILLDWVAAKFPQLTFGLKSEEVLSNFIGEAAWSEGERVYEHSRQFIYGVDTFWCGPEGRDFSDGAYSTPAEVTPNEPLPCPVADSQSDAELFVDGDRPEIVF